MPSDGFSNAEIERIMADLGRKIDEVKVDLRSDITELKSAIADLKSSVVFNDTHQVVVDALRREMDRIDEKADDAKVLAKWSLTVLVALLGTVITIAILIAQNGSP